MTRASGRLVAAASGILLAVALAPAIAAAPGATGGTPPTDASGITTRNGQEIYRQFRDGLATPTCGPEVSARWSKHFAAAPKRLAKADANTLALFGYVVDNLRKSSLPTEYALIPFVESGYKPAARSPAGPAGLWQMIKRTARDHDVPIRNGYDGRLSPVDSTRAAVRYLKTLHGMFAGDWRLAAMAYNAGEYRILGALKRGGQVARDARPAELPGLSGITRAYVRKLHALACVLTAAGDDEPWLQALDRPVPRLEVVTVPAGIDRIEAWAAANDQDAERLRRLNPAFADGRIRHGATPARLLALASAPTGNATAQAAPATGEAAGGN
ncbi:transglycosylase SLT domain-containing protein [Lysobacter sp. F60174L2]|uniref:transglycosylase SLT domain-containing protein n=1 Tax=Lysobacter sp. F60174L2 TaxID=3459295 RepID=UPI00403E0004